MTTKTVRFPPALRCSAAHYTHEQNKKRLLHTLGKLRNGKKIEGVYKTPNSSPSQSYRASPATWDHTDWVLHDNTCHPTQVNAPPIDSNQEGRHSIYLPQRDQRLSWPWWLVIY